VTAAGPISKSAEAAQQDSSIDAQNEKLDERKPIAGRPIHEGSMMSSNRNLRTGRPVADSSWR